jgi:hypothetical protein
MAKAKTLDYGPKKQAKPYDADKFNAKDAADIKEAVNDHATTLDAHSDALKVAPNFRPGFPGGSLNDFCAWCFDNLQSGPVVPPLTYAPLVIIDGQSNATGYDKRDWRADADLVALSPSIAREFQRVFIWNPLTGTFQKLKAGVNNLGRDANSLDVCIGLAQAWEAQNPTGTLYLVKAGWPGQSITTWVKGAADSHYDYLASLVQDAKAAMAVLGYTAVVKGLYWNQWESDDKDQSYLPKLTTLMSNWQTDGVFGSDTLQIIARADSELIRAQQTQYAADHADVARLLSIDNYARVPDENVHYSNRAQFLSGYNLFNALFSTALAYPVPMVPVVVDPAPTTEDVMQETDSRLFLSDGWTRGNLDPATSGGSDAFARAGTNGPTQVCGITFTGDHFAFDTLDYGFGIKGDVYDGETKLGTFAYNDSQGVVERYAVDLPNGTHHIRIVARYDEFVLLDRFRCRGTFQQYSGPTTIPA